MDEFAEKITRRLDAIEGIARRLRSNDGDAVGLYTSARVLIDEIRDDAERFPAPANIGEKLVSMRIGEKLVSMRGHLGALAELDRWDLPGGSGQHLTYVLSDCDTIRNIVLRHQ